MPDAPPDARSPTHPEWRPRAVRANPCPDTNGFARRVLLFGGLLFMFAALAVATFVKGVAAWVPVVMALIGGSLIPNNKIAELLNAWKKGSPA